MERNIGSKVYRFQPDLMYFILVHIYIALDEIDEVSDNIDTYDRFLSVKPFV